MGEVCAKWKLVPEIRVTLEACVGLFCHKVGTFIDASHLVPEALAPTPPPQPAQKFILPFRISRTYNDGEKSYGDLSYAGTYVIQAFAGGFGENMWRVAREKNTDFIFELVPETMLVASGSGTVEVLRQELYEEETDPEGVFEADWEILLYLDEGPDDGGVLYFISYDHVVNVLVESGQRVEQGQPLARGRPARVGNQGCDEGDPHCKILSTSRPVDWVEWGLKRTVGPNGEQSDGDGLWSLCWEPFLAPEHQLFIQNALTQMRVLGFRAGKSACLTDEFRDDHTSDTLASW